MARNILNPELLYAAYSQGYFPMPDGDSEQILWFRPDPRAVIPLDNFHVSRSLKRKLNKEDFKVSYDQDFERVMLGCADHPNTWINEEFISVYTRLHSLGLAHSVEVWSDSKLIGGTYGVCLGGAFFAESKFHKRADASKIALYFLVKRMLERGFTLLECQFLTPHLQTLGAIEISDADYIDRLGHALEQRVSFT